MDHRLPATLDMAQEFSELFVNRRAYTIQSMRPHPESGRHYYYRPKPRDGGEPVELTVETVRRHLAGEMTIGIYAINPATQRCKWMAIDADYKTALEDLIKVQRQLQDDGIEAALEKSKRGGHLWIFFETPVLAREARIYIYHVAGKLDVQVKGTGLADGIEIFPKQDELRREEFGNAIRGTPGGSLGSSGEPGLAVLVLRRRLQAGGSTRVPEAAQESEGRAPAAHDRWEDDSAGIRSARAANGMSEVFRVKARRVPDSGLRRGEEASRPELGDSLPIVRRARARQERRQPGDLGRGAAEILLLGGLHERDDSRGSGPADLRSEAGVTGTVDLLESAGVLSDWIVVSGCYCRVQPCCVGWTRGRGLGAVLQSAAMVVIAVAGVLDLKRKEGVSKMPNSEQPEGRDNGTQATQPRSAW